MKSRIPAAISLALIVWSGSTVFSNAGEPGVDSDTIAFAQSSCFTGVCGETGRQFRAGIRAAFHERNLLGGVGGRKLALMSQDDAYDATTAAANAAILPLTMVSLPSLADLERLQRGAWHQYCKVPAFPLSAFFLVPASCMIACAFQTL